MRSGAKVKALLASLRNRLSLTQRRRAARRHFVICGDILSCTGYAKSARALAQLLQAFGTVSGVALQIDPNDCSEHFPGSLLSLDALLDLATSEDLVVIHHATPEHFLVIPGAVNIGFFYWETRSIPRELHWPERLALMDAIWAPTTFIADFAREAGYTGPITVVPWWQAFPDLNKRKRLPVPEVDVHLVERMPAADEPLWSAVKPLDRVLMKHDLVALAIQSLAPRKGLQLLLDEWRSFIAANPASNAILLLKLSFVHAHGIAGGPEQHLRKLLGRYGFAEDDRVQIGLVNARLSDAAIHALHQASDVYLTASLGEGFGGPIVEALQEGTPVIAPRHTGIADLLPTATPLAVPCSEYLVGLRDNIEVYPHSSYWHVIDRGEMAKRLEMLHSMDTAARAALMHEQREHAVGFCSKAAVREALAGAVKRIGTG